MPAALQRATSPAATLSVAHGDARPSAARRGYDADWRRFRLWVRRRMIALGIAPVCGASLPGGPDLSTESRCRQSNVLVDQHLHLHHKPGLTPAERQNPKAVCNPVRVGWLCETCHNTVRDPGEGVTA